MKAIVEFAGPDQAQAQELAERYGFTGSPNFILSCGAMCVLRYERERPPPPSRAAQTEQLEPRW